MLKGRLIATRTPEKKHFKGYDVATDVIGSCDAIGNVTIRLPVSTFLQAPNRKQPDISIIFRDIEDAVIASYTNIYVDL